jgi:hypothetical protein
MYAAGEDSTTHDPLIHHHKPSPAEQNVHHTNPLKLERTLRLPYFFFLM